MKANAMLMVLMAVFKVDKKSFCCKIKDITDLIYRPIIDHRLIGTYFESRPRKWYINFSEVTQMVE